MDDEIRSLLNSIPESREERIVRLFAPDYRVEPELMIQLHTLREQLASLEQPIRQNSWDQTPLEKVDLIIQTLRPIITHQILYSSENIRETLRRSRENDELREQEAQEERERHASPFDLPRRPPQPRITTPERAAYYERIRIETARYRL